MKTRWIIICIFFLALCGCATGGYRRLYDNGALSNKDVASIEAGGCVTVLRIGSQFDLLAESEKSGEYDYEKVQKFLVLPGTYDIEVGVPEESPAGAFAGKAIRSVKLQAGHRYVFSGVLGEPDLHGTFAVTSKGHFATTGISKGGNFILREPDVVAHFSKWNLRIDEYNGEKIELVNDWVDFSPPRGE
jgi:hypothetical protein